MGGACQKRRIIAALKAKSAEAGDVKSLILDSSAKHSAPPRRTPQNSQADQHRIVITFKGTADDLLNDSTKEGIIEGMINLQ